MGSCKSKIQTETCTETTSTHAGVVETCRQPQTNHKTRKAKKNISKVLRRKVWDYHFGPDVGSVKCPCCEDTVIRQMEFHCGHIIPECKGGPTTVENLIPICAMCNLSMAQQH